MTYNVLSQDSTSERVAMSLLAAGIMFVAGYTVVRVGFAQNTAVDPAVQTNVVPHQSAMWTDAFSENY